LRDIFYKTIISVYIELEVKYMAEELKCPVCGMKLKNNEELMKHKKETHM
jgi:uncharacterized C2H2 Zn-finger protein